MGPLPTFDLEIMSVLKTKLNDLTVELNPDVERKSLHQYSLFFSIQTGTWANCHVSHCLFGGGMNLMENHMLHWTSTTGVIASGTIGGPWSHIFGQFQVLRWAPTLINYTWKEPCTHPAPACSVMGRFLLSGWQGGQWAPFALLCLLGSNRCVPHSTRPEPQERGQCCNCHWKDQGTFL